MIVVTGMHRSGTSFISNLLHSMGADLGQDDLLLQRDQWNQRGYFENVDILIFNNRLILGSTAAILYRMTVNSGMPERVITWTRTLLNLPAFVFPVIYGLNRRASKHSDEIVRLSSKYRNTVIKDVRFSLTIGAWRNYGEIEKVLYCYRHPMEVAMSLKKRQHIPLWKGLQLWEQHVEQFLKQSEGLPVVMVNYHHFMDKEDVALQECRRLYEFMGNSFNEQQAKQLLSSVREDRLYHNRSKDVTLPARIQALWRQLNELHKKHKQLLLFWNF